MASNLPDHPLLPLFPSTLQARFFQIFLRKTKAKNSRTIKKKLDNAVTSDNDNHLFKPTQTFTQSHTTISKATESPKH
jgi:hypothetical protein